MCVGFEEAFLEDVFGVLVVLSDVLSQTINLAFVPLHEFTECSRIAGTSALYKRQFVVDVGARCHAHHPMIR